MRMNNRGMFFTLITISVLSLLAASYSFYSYFDDRSSVDSRIESLNRNILSMQEDFERKLYIAGFRIILVYEKRIAESGNYISDVESTFQEVFFDGTIEGSLDEEEQTLLSGVLFEDIIGGLQSNLEEVNLDFIFENPEVFVFQEDPWNIRVRLVGDMRIEDLSGLANWEKETEIVAVIPVSHFEDPFYVVGSRGVAPRRVIQSPYTFDFGDLTNITNHLEGKYYVSSSLAPSFLMRLEGNFSSDINGVESLVYLPDLSEQKDKSIVDYIYFSSSNPESNSISGMPSWVKLDEVHRNFYNLTA